MVYIVSSLGKNFSFWKDLRFLGHRPRLLSTEGRFTFFAIVLAYFLRRGASLYFICHLPSSSKGSLTFYEGTLRFLCHSPRFLSTKGRFAYFICHRPRKDRLLSTKGRFTFFAIVLTSFVRRDASLYFICHLPSSSKGSLTFYEGMLRFSLPSFSLEGTLRLGGLLIRLFVCRFAFL